ncbi:hypothetical protein GGS21DRAFT_225446 [Xylaria nigripes]|nr:hypothetical protein GGS21DRAFT_225446 [Xylaria nigripes]
MKCIHKVTTLLTLTTLLLFLLLLLRPTLTISDPDPPETLYATLEIEPNATDAEIRHAYRVQSRRFHPDKTARLGPDEQASARANFQRVQMSRDVLLSEARCEYDRYVMGSSLTQLRACLRLAAERDRERESVAEETEEELEREEEKEGGKERDLIRGSEKGLLVFRRDTTVLRWLMSAVNGLAEWMQTRLFNLNISIAKMFRQRERGSSVMPLDADDH